MKEDNMKHTNENINDKIKEWHDSDSELKLYDYLGWTWDQYIDWVTTNELPN
jgi:hypothetical protein